MNLAEARKELRRVFLLYDPSSEQAYLNEDRPSAQKWADDGKLALEYGLIGRIKGANDVSVPVSEVTG